LSAGARACPSHPQLCPAANIASARASGRRSRLSAQLPPPSSYAVPCGRALAPPTCASRARVGPTVAAAGAHLLRQRLLYQLGLFLLLLLLLPALLRGRGASSLRLLCERRAGGRCAARSTVRRATRRDVCARRSVRCTYRTMHDKVQPCACASSTMGHRNCEQAAWCLPLLARKGAASTTSAVWLCFAARPQVQSFMSQRGRQHAGSDQARRSACWHLPAPAGGAGGAHPRRAAPPPPPPRPLRIRRPARAAAPPGCPPAPARRAGGSGVMCMRAERSALQMTLRCCVALWSQRCSAPALRAPPILKHAQLCSAAGPPANLHTRCAGCTPLHHTLHSDPDVKQPHEIKRRQGRVSTAAETRSSNAAKSSTACNKDRSGHQGQASETALPQPQALRRDLAAQPQHRPSQQHPFRNAKQLGAAWRHPPRAGRQATWYTADSQAARPATQGAPALPPARQGPASGRPAARA